jgi:spermidine synthase
MTDRITEVSESDAQTSYPITQRVWEGRTAFQEVVIADSPTYGRMLFLDGELQSASADEHIYHSALVHPVMGRLPAGRCASARVLVVGGGEGATVREVLRWGVAAVDWVDIDGELVSVCEDHLGWAPGVLRDPRVRYVAVDIRDWLRSVIGGPASAFAEASHTGNAARGSGCTYDVIILDLPDPDGDTGYLYSPDFWQDIQRFLKTDGLFVTHVGPVRPYDGIGEGAKRVVETAREGGIKLTRDGFYHIGIPSFQGEWGFWMGSVGCLGETWMVLEDEDVADADQMNAWARPSRVWKTAVSALLS